MSSHTQILHSAYIKANTSISRLRPKLTKWLAASNASGITPQTSPITASTDRLQHIQRFHAVKRKPGPDRPGQLVSNLTHYSPSDPDARVAFKTGKSCQLAYLASVSVDIAQHVITHVHADLAD